MPETRIKDITGGRFRAGARYRLALFDRLPPEQQELLRDLRKDPDLYGVLLPDEGAGRNIKSVCRETALLFLTLQEPGPLPGYVRTLFGDGCAREIAQLVLDGVLEVAAEEGFLSGAAASALLYEAPPPSADGGRIARLSEDALRYAQALEIEDAQMLSARLYFYNRLPASPRRQRLLPSADAARAFLGLESSGGRRPRWERDWAPVPLPPPHDGWLMWEARGGVSLSAANAYKLYVSPRVENLPDALRATVAALTDVGAPRFKIGRDVFGLLRPDKIVAYFPSFDPLREAAVRLETALAGCPAQGVPFTAEIGGDGLLSWGMDPPRARQQVLDWQERESWRLWVTNRLATALLAARAAPPGDRPPWRFALERLALEGVDTQTWAPQASLWQDPTGAH